jgi:hypothetical protein
MDHLTDGDISKSIKSLQNLRMEEATKARIRGAIFEQIKNNSPSLVSPYSSPHFHLKFWLKPAGVGIFVAIFLTGGMASAAEKSLPGDILYNVKVGLTEPILGVLVSDGEKELDWRLAQAKRRLDEAVTLASLGRLTPEIDKDLAIRFQGHLALAHQDEDEEFATDSNEEGAVMMMAVESSLATEAPADLATNTALIPKEKPLARELPPSFITSLREYDKTLRNLSNQKADRLLHGISEEIERATTTTIDEVNDIMSDVSNILSPTGNNKSHTKTDAPQPLKRTNKDSENIVLKNDGVSTLIKTEIPTKLNKYLPLWESIPKASEEPVAETSSDRKD